ncbi:MAG: regulatory protein RecX [Crocinitomicaceae bacterium]|nr:regulatory protein RecX [Crocinitomicaceae bacterium]
MIQWKMPADDRNALLAHLIEFNFLSEERFAEAYVSGKINIKKWGRIKIRQQLKLKHISEYSIKRAIDAVDNDVYWKNLKGLAEKKYASLSTQKDSYDKKVKVYRFLSSKGYETDLLRDASDELFNT